jgi:hypothetical protein
MTLDRLRALAVALDARAAALDDGILPPELRAMLSRCRADLAVIRAATDADVARLLDEADAVVSFEVLRGLVRRH